MVAVVRPDGSLVYANNMLEDALGASRRQLQGTPLSTHFVDRHLLEHALRGAQDNEFAALRYDAWMQRRPLTPAPGHSNGGSVVAHSVSESALTKKASDDPILVHVIVTPTGHQDEAVVEILPLEQQARLEREERLAEQTQINRELIRNLAHEIKNPLGGIRGAAQLLDMDAQTKDMREYTQVIIREADRLQLLVDNLLAPHRRPHQVGDVNIHEVTERVRSLILAEFPKGLRVQRDYDISLPEFRGDREQLIQTVLNLAHNACQALADQIAAETAGITFRTRVARGVTLGKQRYRLALELHVIDNGPGVPEAIRERMFYPLVSGREGGSGLGLTLAQTFVQQHHGTITCESVPGHTDFQILIPLP
jgi:two-component system, NtrC family, nitrogen regulation sensor histidine kinase GlnL